MPNQKNYVCLLGQSSKYWKAHLFGTMLGIVLQSLATIATFFFDTFLIIKLEIKEKL